MNSISDHPWYGLVRRIHDAPTGCVLALTGGGANAVAALLGVPGGSRSILEVSIPYGADSLADYLGAAPEHSCSLSTARALANRALARARLLAPGRPVVGLGCTASLATDRPKRGDHRVHVCACRTAGGKSLSLRLQKGARDRSEEEAVVQAIVVNALAEVVGVPSDMQPRLLAGETLQVESVQPDAISQFLEALGTPLCVEPDGRMRLTAPRAQVLLPGSFNPVHAGHWGLAAAAERRLNTSAAFELSVQNADKPSLGAEEIRRRLQAFTWRACVWLTGAATFVEKARLFPGVCFVIGADTADRLVARRYYGDDAQGVEKALQAIRQAQCSFLVACRPASRGAVARLADVPIPASQRDLFAEIPEADFCCDLSSTDLRVAGDASSQDSSS